MKAYLPLQAVNMIKGFSQARCLGATVTDRALCSGSGHTGIGLHYGLTYGLGFEDVLGCGTVVFWGNNARVSSPHLWAISMRARKENGPELL